MAEMHVFGQLLGASQFQTPDHRLLCKWTLHHTNSWRLIEGVGEGQTQLDEPQLEDVAYFCHPIDLHLVATSVQSWPKIEFEIWRQDSYGRTYLVSYGFVHLPTEPGYHQIECNTWKPVGNYIDQIYTIFTSGALRLQDSSVVHEGTDRFRLQTESSGKIYLNLYVIMRNFDQYGINTGQQ